VFSSANHHENRADDASSSTTFSSTVPEALRGRRRFPARLPPTADRLRVATALEVEHAVLAPAVLVITDQRPARIGRKRRFAGARKAEEDCRVTCRAHVGRAVHGHDALRRQQVI